MPVPLRELADSKPGASLTGVAYPHAAATGAHEAAVVGLAAAAEPSAAPPDGVPPVARCSVVAAATR